MLTFQHTLKGLLLLACLYTCSSAPLTCNPVKSAECFANFSQEIMRVALPHLAQNISVANTNLSFVSQLCSEYTLTYLPCVTPALVGCPAWSYITYEMTSAAAEYICHSRETVVRSALECLSVPSVAPTVMGCNEAALASTEPCHPAYTWQKCISDVTSDVCTVSSNAALSDVIAHSLQPMFDLYPCHNDSGTSVTSEPEPEITGETASSEPEPEITGETASSEPEPEITGETASSEPEPEITRETASSEPEPEITGETASSEPEPEITGETASSEPEPEITGETASSEPEPEITGETASSEPEPEITRETASSEPEPEVTSSAPLTCNPVRSAECFANFSQEIMRVALPHLAQNISVANTNLSFVSQLCSEYTLTYLPCVTPALVGCPAWSYITYEMTSAAAEYICHSRETVVRSALECLSVPSVAPAVMGCNEAALASTEPCHPAYTWQKCISDVTSDVCTVSSNAALSDVIAHSLQPMFDLYPCHNDSGTSVTSEPEPEITGETASSEPEPEITGETASSEPEPEITGETASSEPEPEITRETASSEPEPEITRETASSEPEPEITGETASSEPEPEVTSTPSDVCNLPAFTMCSAELNQDLQVWMANVIPDMMLTRSFNFSHLDTLCSVHYRKYKQCVWSVTLGCRKDLMLSRDMMVSAFDFICSADKEALSSTIPCLSQPSVAQGMQSCAGTASTSGVCSYTTNYKRCVSDVISGCTSSAKDVINDLVDTLLKPLKETFPCDVDTSTVLPTFLTSTTTKPTFKTTTRVTPTPQIVTGGAIGTGQCGRECKDLLNVPISRMPTALMAGNFSLTIYTDACPLFESFRQCMAALSDPCEIPAVENSVFSAFEYACGTGYSAIIEYDDCWERTDIQATWTSCINEFSASLANGSQDGLCRYLDRLSLCVTEKVATCGQVPVAIVSDYFNASTYIVRRLYNCSLAQPTTIETTTTPAVPTAHSSSPTSTTPASTTTTPNSTTTSPASTSVAASTQSSHQNQTVTTPKLPITCFDCNSGYSSSRNTQCTIDGHIATNLVGKTTCMDRCFAKTNKWNKGVIFRGCAAGFWMPEARPLPRSGCHMIREEMWCFCDGDFCNDMPMARFV